jgi:hypothetical protein
LILGFGDLEGVTVAVLNLEVLSLSLVSFDDSILWGFMMGMILFGLGMIIHRWTLILMLRGIP